MGFESNVDHPKLLRYLFRSCCDLDLELRPGTAMYKSGPGIELAGDAVDAWPLVSPFVSEQVL